MSAFSSDSGETLDEREDEGWEDSEDEWEWETESDSDSDSAESGSADDEWEEDEEWDAEEGWEGDWEEAEEPTRPGSKRKAAQAASKPKRGAQASSRGKSKSGRGKSKSSKQAKGRSKAKAKQPANLEVSVLGRDSDPLGLGLGMLASLPWVAAYEISLIALGDGKRNAGELVLSTPLLALGTWESPVRWAWVAVASLAVIWIARAELGTLLPRVLRVAGEGLLSALLLGPLLLLAMELLGAPLPGLQDGRGGHVPELATVARFSGGAFYEELLFRVMVPSGLFVLGRIGASFLGLPSRGAAWWAGGVALVGSSLVFAAAHLDGSLSWRGFGGESWDAALFTWRALAGGVLLVLLKVRGLGVAVWTHALFNAAMLLGGGPAVFVG